MKAVKLLTLTSWNYMVIFMALTLFFFVVFYFIIKQEVLSSTDEVLYNRKVHILEEFRRQGLSLSNEFFGYGDFYIAPIARSRNLVNVYSDTLIHESVDNELDEFRKLSSVVELDGKFYRLDIVKPRLETHEIVASIINSLVIVFLLMVLVFYFATRYLSRKLWKPFYTTLDQLNSFEVDQGTALALPPSRIEEFSVLNKSIAGLTERSRAAFLNQKQFIENASHEIQTPLAVAQSKLELLIQDPQLSEVQSQLINTLINSITRLSKLNKILLLISKIGNQQFLQREAVLLSPLIKEILTYFDEQRERLKISVKVSVPQDGIMHCNRELIDLLMANLIKNAFLHNVQNGSVDIIFNDNQFQISNTSTGSAIPNEQLFQRFYKQSSVKESWGLGLAIVKKICDINLWQITYSKIGAIHSFQIKFFKSAKI